MSLPAERWLGRFHERRPLRNYGPLRMYLCRVEPGGEELPVLVGRAVCAPHEARALLDGIARAHARLAHPWIAAVSERGSAGEMDFLVFRHEAASDLETLLALATRRGPPLLPFAAGEGLSLGLLHALGHAHARGEALGFLGPSNLLVGSDGSCRLFGFGGLAPPERGEAARFAAPLGAHGFPPDARDLCAFAACMRSQRRAFERPEALRHAQSGTPLDKPFAWLAQSVAGLEHTLIEARAPLSAEEAVTLLRARHARLGVGACEESLRTELAALVSLAQAEGLRASPGHGERYVFEGPLGTGSTCTVLKAWDRQLRQHVAIKRLSAAPDSESVARLLREVRTLRMVRHPHLVRGYELYEDRGQLGAVMEYVPGPTLRESLVSGALSAAEVRAALAQVADALADLHRMAVLHRDVKPANVILAPERGAVLVDFGVAAPADRGAAWASGTLTAPGTRFGEPRYLAPELMAGAPATRASDVYALARTAGDGLARARAPISLTALDEPLRTRLSRALSEDPRERPSAVELAAALWAEPDDAPGLGCQVALDGRELSVPGGGHVDLRRRSTLRRVLAALARAHHFQPGSPVSRSALFDAGWPGERIDVGSAANRVYVAVAELRKLGLRGALESDGEGYLLSPLSVRSVP